MEHCACKKKHKTLRKRIHKKYTQTSQTYKITFCYYESHCPLESPLKKSQYRFPGVGDSGLFDLSRSGLVEMSLLRAAGLKQEMIFKVPSNLNHSVNLNLTFGILKDEN